MQISANKQKLILILISFLLFHLLSNFGYNLGGDFGLLVMQENFGSPNDLYQFLFGMVMYFTAILFGMCGIFITAILMHQVGRRFKVAVGKPTFYGFLLYLLTLLIIILNFNRTH